MRIAVIGTGYVGLVAGTCFAETGNTVVGVDLRQDVVNALAAGEIPIYEPGLKELVDRNLREERLSFTTDLAYAVAHAEVVFLCVGTPEGPDGRADLSQVFDAAAAIAQAMNGYRVIVSKSTCPVGTADRLRASIAAETMHPFDIVSNPEFLKEGAAVDDFMRPDRVVIGCDSAHARAVMEDLYAPFLRTGKPLLAMTIRSAEMTKYACNAALAARISLINELATIAEAYGADIAAVREGMASDARIGPAFLFAGLGFGGSCFPKDLDALIQLARDEQVPSPMLEATVRVNHEQRLRFVARIVAHYGGGLKGKHIAIWGASFKPRTDDLRCAPSIDVIEALLRHGAEVTVYDPVANSRVAERFGTSIRVAAKPMDALQDAHGLVICTEWNEFRHPDFETMAQKMARKVIFDGRNLYDPQRLAELGFEYYGIGRPAPPTEGNAHSA